MGARARAGQLQLPRRRGPLPGRHHTGRGNLCLFAPDGRASCAYLAPRRIDGRPGHYYDPFANDQDWALAFYLLVEHGI